MDRVTCAFTMIVTGPSTAAVRLILRLYFLLALATTSWIARKVLHASSKISIAKRRSIPATRASGALDGLDLVLAAVSTRSLPGGRAGFFLLLLIFALSKGTDLLTTYLVVGQKLQSRCAFGQGLVFNDNRFDIYSPWNGKPVSVLQNAQMSAISNGCNYGIYRKVNLDLNFCPGEEDMIGSWKCSYVATNRTYPAGTDNATIFEDLITKGLLYENTFLELSHINDSFNHLAMWSTSAASDSDGTEWSIRAAVQTNWQIDTDVQLAVLNCTMNAAGAANTHRNMASLYDLNGWVATFQGLMYWGTNTPAIGDILDQLAILLNTMTMIAGGNNYLLASPQADADQTQGCLVPATLVPPVMVGIFFGTTALFIAMVIAWAVTLVLLKNCKSHLIYEKAKALEMVPHNLQSWALLSAREHNINLSQLGYAGPSSGSQREAEGLLHSAGYHNYPLADMGAAGRGSTTSTLLKDKDLLRFRVGFAQGDSTRIRVFESGKDEIQF